MSDEIVILVVGEIGVGISTWINALTMCLTHLAAAKTNQLINIVPTVFKFSTSKDVNEVNVRVGQSENKNVDEPEEHRT